MAVFPDAEEAVAAAVEARDAARDVAVGDHSARLRAGVHVGRPRMLGGDYLGVDVNVAARVAAAAGPGEVLVTDSVCAQLPESTRVRASGASPARGRRRRPRCSPSNEPGSFDAMIYTLIGKIVVKGAKVFLRRNYGPTYVPKPVLAGAVVASIIGVAVVASKRDDAA